MDRENWTAAADSFRMPYWDTARGSADGGVPPFFLSPRWPIAGPNGTLVIDNPLYWYQFHPLIPGVFSDTDVRRLQPFMLHALNDIDCSLQLHHALAYDSLL